MVGKSQTLPVFTFAQLEAGDFLLGVIVDIFDDSVGEELDFRILFSALQHDLGSAEAVAAVNDRDLGAQSE